MIQQFLHGRRHRQGWSQDWDAALPYTSFQGPSASMQTQANASKPHLQAQLAALAAEAARSAAASVAYLQWQGQKLPARHERVRAAVHLVRGFTCAPSTCS